MTLIVRQRKRRHAGDSGWAVVVEETGEVILTTQFGVTRDDETPFNVYIPWPGFKRDLKVADEAASLALAERVYRRLAERLALQPVTPSQPPGKSDSTAKGSEAPT